MRISSLTPFFKWKWQLNGHAGPGQPEPMTSEQHRAKTSQARPTPGGLAAMPLQRWANEANRASETHYDLKSGWLRILGPPEQYVKNWRLMRPAQTRCAHIWIIFIYIYIYIYICKSIFVFEICKHNLYIIYIYNIYIYIYIMLVYMMKTLL